MTILLTVTETWILYIGIVLATILIIGAVLFFICGLRSKREKKVVHVVIDEKFISDLLLGLGSEGNIKEVSIDNGRVKFKVNDLDSLDTDTLKTLSSSGVFITGNNVKLLFKYDSAVIFEELIKRGVAK